MRFTRKLHYCSSNAGSGLINNLAADTSQLVLSVLLPTGGSSCSLCESASAIFAGWSIGAAETMRESYKVALPGPAKPPFRGQESGSFSRNPRTFLAFTPSAHFGRLIWMLLRPAQGHTCHAAHSSEDKVIANGVLRHLLTIESRLGPPLGSSDPIELMNKKKIPYVLEEALARRSEITQLLARAAENP